MTAPLGVPPYFRHEIEHVLLIEPEKSCSKLRWVPESMLIDVVASLVERRGAYPMSSSHFSGEPDVYIGAQVRKIAEGNYVVAGVDLSPTHQRFASVYCAVEAYLRPEFKR